MAFGRSEQGYDHEKPEQWRASDGMEYDDDLHVECPPHTTERKLTAKIDLHVVPFLCILYLLAFLDRVNIANANVFGMSTELGLNGNKYNTALVIFFVPYILFEIPSNVLLKKFSLFFCSTSLAGAFGGLIAAGIGKMNGVGGYAGWRWIFILEGALTCVVSVAFFFVLPDFPEESKWLAESERAYVASRLRADQGNSARERKITPKDVGRVFKDIKIWIGGFMYFGLIVPAYGYAYFAPGIIRGYGYSVIQTQLHSVPPWAAAFGFAMLLAILSDKFKHRFAFAVFAICVAIAGFAILISVHNNRPLQYAALFLVAMGAYSAMPIIVCWFNMNLGGHHRRSVGSAWQVSFGNIGGIIAVFAFLQKDAPLYVTGYSVCIAFTCLSILACMAYFIVCSIQNRNRDRSPTDVGLTEYEKTEMGDLSPDYRYLL